MEIMEGYATVPVMHYAMGEVAAVPIAGHLMDAMDCRNNVRSALGYVSRQIRTR